jgi:AcrR family transcriptional regulator
MGRPRRYDPDTEVAMLVESLWHLLAAKPFKELTVAEMLSMSGLSTRSFYRHFSSKDDVLWFIYRTEASTLEDNLEERLARTAGTVEAFVVWIDTLLGLAYDPEAAKRTAILRAAVRQIDPRLVPPRSDGTVSFVRILRKIIERGQLEGLFPRAEPEDDAWAVNALVWDSIDSVGTGQRRISRNKARDSILRFSLPALGYGGTDHTVQTPKWRGKKRGTPPSL